jgi:hypothetical protein
MNTSLIVGREERCSSDYALCFMLHALYFILNASRFMLSAV